MTANKDNPSAGLAGPLGPSAASLRRQAGVRSKAVAGALPQAPVAEL